jgi:hypothetical protein
VVAVTTRGLGWGVLALVVGAGIGVGAAYATRPEPDSIGTPAPVPAAAPDVPTDDPYAPDLDYPALEEIDSFDTYRIGGGPQFQTWEYPVPEGWVAYSVTQNDDRLIPPEAVAGQVEVRFRPEGEPKVGGFSLRVKAIDNHAPPLDEVNDKVADFDELYEDVEVLDRTDTTVFFTFRTEGDLFRYNFFQWFAEPGSEEATLEMSVAGRAVDEPGLRALFDQFAEQAEPVED